jgi:hypothetical protein
MKILINENRVFDSIYRYIDNMIDTNDIHRTYGRDEDEDGYYGAEMENENFLIFYKGDWEGEDFSNNIFYYFTEDYYDEESSSKPFKDSAPTLDVLETYGKELDTMFGKHWRGPMKKWFEDNFKLPVKTINTWY